MQLRQYQQDFSRNLATSVKQHQKTIACLPTGGGKTAVFLAIAKAALQKGRTVLIISESRKIFSQIQEQGNGIQINADTKKVFGVLPNRIYIAMAQTLVRRELILDQFIKLQDSLFVINDEAHIGTSTKLLQQLANSMLIGFTATPDYNAAPHLPLLYNDCVVGAQVSDLLQLGFLSPYRHYARVGADLDKLKLKKGEFTEESQEQAFENSDVYEGLLEDLKNFKYKKALIFCASIAHCKDMVAQLEYAGYKVAEVHSACTESDANLAAFMYGDIDICVNVGILTKGFDFPKIDLIALVRATTSLPLYLQIGGRGMRIYDDKTHLTFLDYGQNYKRFGLLDMDRDWLNMWKIDKKKKQKDTNGIAPIKMCPKCMAVIAASAIVCEYCGELLTEGQQKDLQQGELVEINEAIQKMRGRLISQLSAEELAIYCRMRNKKGYGIRIARAREQNDPGYLAEYAKNMNYKPYWVNIQLQSIGEEKIEFYDIVIR
jgi:superfamily II DNA or RNA helicase